MAYDAKVNYKKLIDDAVSKGDYASASAYEQQRNEKIDGEGLTQYTKTNNYTKPQGMSGEQYNKVNSSFTPNDTYNNYQAQADSDSNSYRTHTQGEMISSDTKSKLNTSFNMPNSVKQADKWLSSQLKLIQSGRTSYTDQVQEMMDKIMNRDKFSYDVDNDTMFQQALASAMKSGQTAMQDTIGQASALTGGYGSTYATSAGNQAYNAFIEDAYNNLPEYYKMALDAYNSEGEDMYRQYGMLSAEDEKEYNRNVTAYDATFQYRNQMYNEAYGQYRDEKSDAFSMANLEMQQYSQKSNDLYNLYAMSSDRADKEYERQYQSWYDDVTMALEMGKMGQTDYWNQKGYDWQDTNREDTQAHEEYMVGVEEKSQINIDNNQSANNITEMGVDTENKAKLIGVQADADIKVEKASLDNRLVEMAAQFGYDEKKLKIDLANTLTIMKEQHGYDIEKINVNKLAEEYLMGVQNGYTMEQMAQQFVNNKALQDDAQEFEGGQNALYSGSKGSGGSSGGSSSGGSKPITFSDTEINTIKDMYKNGASDQEVIDYLYTKGKYISEEDLWMIDMYKNAQAKEDILTPSTTGSITNSGLLASFKTNKGDNFDVTVGNKTYKVENKGLASENAHAILDNLNVKDGQVFAYDDEGTTRVYVKKDNKYYKVGAVALGGGAFKDLKQALLQ